MRSKLLRIVPAVTLPFLLFLSGWASAIPICLRAVSSASGCDVRLNAAVASRNCRRAGYARAALVVQAHVELQRRGSLAAGRGADAGDLEQPQSVRPRD